MPSNQWLKLGKLRQTEKHSGSGNPLFLFGSSVIICYYSRLISILKLPRAVSEEVARDPFRDGAGDLGTDDLWVVLCWPHKLLNAGQAVHICVMEGAGLRTGTLVWSCATEVKSMFPIVYIKTRWNWSSLKTDFKRENKDFPLIQFEQRDHMEKRFPTWFLDLRLMDGSHCCCLLTVVSLMQD